MLGGDDASPLCHAGCCAIAGAVEIVTTYVYVRAEYRIEPPQYARAQVKMKEATMQSLAPDSIRPNGRPELPFLESAGQTLTGRILITIAATAVIAAGAHISFRLPFTPVPLTLSDFAVLLVGMALGPATAFSAVLLYLAEGAAGMPVFNPQGLGGIAQLIGPTAGYLFAYPFAAAVAGCAGSLRRAGMSDFTSAILAGTGATAIILGLGAAWLGHSRFLTASSTWYVAVAPFLFGAAAKIVAAALIFSSTRRWLRS